MIAATPIPDGAPGTRAVRLIACVLLLLLVACASVPDAPSTPDPDAGVVPGLDSQAFAPPLALPSPASLFALSPSQQAEFLRHFNDPAHAELAPHERLADYLEQRLGHFSYDGATVTATTALAEEKGNCLSLALVTAALARLVGVEVGYQRMRDEPVFERNGRMVLVADHVRSLLFGPDRVRRPGELSGLPPHIVIDYFPDHRRRRGGRVSESALPAMFYANLAAEALAMNQDREAFWMLRAALELDPTSADALNGLAVLHRRLGQDIIAEAVYRHALARHSSDLSLLGNYRALLAGQGRLEEASAIDDRLARLPVRNPYDLIDRGNQAFAQDRPQAALQFYRQALERAPYLHEAYWRQAVVYHSLGAHAQALTLLDRATRAAARPRDRRLYAAKVQFLRGLSRP